MSISMNTPINTALPVSESRSSVIKKGSGAADGTVKADFSAMINGTPEPAHHDVVTAEEKRYFASLFPGASDAIQSYGGYSPAGTKKPVQIGVHIDRKG